MITSYSLYQNDLPVYQGLGLTHELGDLQPYSLHVFRLEVCTAQGCGLSGEVSTGEHQYNAGLDRSCGPTASISSGSKSALPRGVASVVK